MPWKDPKKRAAAVQRWRERNRDKMRTYNQKAQLGKRNWRLLRDYGISQEQYTRLVDEQQGRCAICNQMPVKPLVIDHDHESGVLRGLLCDSCNIGLGMFGDSVKRLFKAGIYLQQRTVKRRESA